MNILINSSNITPSSPRRRGPRFLLPLALALITTPPTFASSDEAWAALDKASATACIKASGLPKAKAGPATQFSDKIGYDARLITGTTPQKHMNNAKATMLCLYRRKDGTVEVQELDEVVSDHKITVAKYLIFV